MSRLVRLRFSVLLLAFFLVGLAQPTRSQIYFAVTDTADAGKGTLRDAINLANIQTGTDRVHIIFDLPPGTDVDGVWTIKLQSMLPSITRSGVIIDGSSQPGASCGSMLSGLGHTLNVVLDGSALVGPNIGLNVLADTVGIGGLVIHSFWNGISSEGDQTLVACSYIGTDETGKLDLGNTHRGIEYFGDYGVVVNSLVSGNDENGMMLWGHSVTVQGNLVGTDYSGQFALGNLAGGISADGDTLQIGGLLPQDRNVVSGNYMGVFVGDTVKVCAIENNLIGLNLDGDAPIPNEYGVELLNYCRVGSGTAPGRNVISGNISYGLRVSSFAIGSDILSNRVGTNLAGTAAVPNGLYGIGTWDSTRVIGNLVSGNNSQGVVIQGNGVVVDGNRVGTDVNGTLAIPNRLEGISVQGDSALIGVGAPNLVSGNGRNGMDITGTGTVLKNNLIGVDIFQNAALPNQGSGIIDFGTDTWIRENVISGNNAYGIKLVSSTNTLIEANAIGTDAAGSIDLGNGYDGVEVNGTGMIGGTNPDNGNIIAFNGMNGIRSVGYNTPFLGNRIHENDALGIDLMGDGVTSNDRDDADAGPNDLQNYPILSPIVTDGLSAVNVSFFLQSTPVDSFRIEFFGNTNPDPSGNGEGEYFLEAVDVMTDVNGVANGSDTFSPLELPLGDWVTATATRIEPGAVFGPTSEFSPAVEVADTPLLTARLLLEGPYWEAGEMRVLDTYSDAIPTSQPYSSPVFDGSLLEFDVPVFVSPLPDGLIDWIVVSLRTGTSLGSEVARRVAFLGEGGFVHELDTSVPFAFDGVPVGHYYVVACQRNHLCVMSDTLVDMTSGIAEHDFTNGSAYSGAGAAQKDLGDGRHALFACNAVLNPPAPNATAETVSIADLNEYLHATTVGRIGYDNADANLDGDVQGVDYDICLGNYVEDATSQVP